MTDAQSVFDELLRHVAQRYPDATIDVRPALQVRDVVIADIERPNAVVPDVQLIAAEGGAFTLAFVGRYTFECLPIEDLPDFLASLYEARYTVKERRFPWALLSLTVWFKDDVLRAVVRYRPGDLDEWEIEALQR